MAGQREWFPILCGALLFGQGWGVRAAPTVEAAAALETPSESTEAPSAAETESPPRTEPLSEMTTPAPADSGDGAGRDTDEMDLRPAPPRPDDNDQPASTPTDEPIAESPNFPAGPGEPTLVVLVLPLAVHRVDAALGPVLDELLASELATRPNLKITTMSDLNAFFAAEKLKDVVGCEDVSCSVEIGGAIGADRILTGSVGHLGQKDFLTLRWLDAVYNESISQVTEVIAGGEAAAPAAIRRGVARLFAESKATDAADRQRKRFPTFWTAEVSGGASWLNAPEPYNTELNGTVRLAWGGHPRGMDTLFYLVGGFGLTYCAGSANGATGKLRYSRNQMVPFLELRAAKPVANRRRTRLYAGVGGGWVIEQLRATQSEGFQPADTLHFGELRAVAGLWHRWHRRFSVWGGYRMQLLFRGDGADPLSELVQLGTTRSTFWIHEIELGGAVHF